MLRQSQLKKQRYSIFFFLIAVLTILTLCLISNRGLDFTDEGLYLLFTNPAQEFKFSPTNYDIFFKIFYRYFNIKFSIQGLRILRIVLTFIGSVYFYFGTAKLVNKYVGSINLTSVSHFLFFVSVGFFANYTFLIQTPGYNDFSLIGVQIFAGSMLLFHFSDKLSFYRILFYFISLYSGFLILLLAKPTGIPFSIIFSFGLLLIDCEKRKLVRLLILWLAIAAITIFFPISDRVSIAKYYETFVIFNKNSTQHALSALFFKSAFGLAFLISGFFLGIILARRLKNINKISSVNWLILMFLIIILFCFDYKRALHLYGTTRNYYDIYIFSRINYVLSFLLSLYLGNISYEKGVKMKTFLTLVFISFCLFLASFFGTDGSFVSNFAKSFQFLLIVFYVLLPEKRLNRFAIIFSSLLFIKFLITYCYLNPYNQEPFLSQTYKVQYGDDQRNTVCLDAYSYESQNTFNKLISKYDTRYVLSFGNLNGNVYLANRVSPGSILVGTEDLSNFFKYKFNFPESFILAGTDLQCKKIFPYLTGYNNEHYTNEVIKMSGTIDLPLSFYFCKRK